jgi:hypothetical protein
VLIALSELRLFVFDFFRWGILKEEKPFSMFLSLKSVD